MTIEASTTESHLVSAGCPGAETESKSDPVTAHYSGRPVLYFRACLKLFKIAPVDFFAPNSKHRVGVRPAKRGKGRAGNESEDQTPEQRHKAMTGFCSCKTGIPSIHGHNMGATPEAGVQSFRSCSRP